MVGGENQLARFFRVFGHGNASGGQQRQGFVVNAAFGQGDGDAHSAAVGKGGVSGDAFDVGAQSAQLVFHAVVAAVQVVNALDGGFTVRHQTGDHQTGRGAQIRGD